jgi:hypothetical protein
MTYKGGSVLFRNPTNIPQQIEEILKFTTNVEEFRIQETNSVIIYIS